MSDLIKRSDAIATIGVMYERCDTYDITDYRDLMLESVKILGSADRPSGEWIYQDDDVFAGKYFCDNCNTQAEVNLYGEWILSKFCPNCGCRMKGADDE